VKAIGSPVKSYRAPLAAWYGVAMAVTWIPVGIWSDCRGVGCTALLVGPTLRLGFAFGPPIVHWNRGHVARGFLSLGGQVAAVAVGASVGSAVSHKPNCPDVPDSSCPADLGPFVGWLVADAVWAVVDVITTPVNAVPASTSASVAPTLRATSGGAAVGVSGSF
jgi:hypothetical protein